MPPIESRRGASAAAGETTGNQSGHRPTRKRRVSPSSTEDLLPDRTSPTDTQSVTLSGNAGQSAPFTRAVAQRSWLRHSAPRRARVDQSRGGPSGSFALGERTVEAHPSILSTLAIGTPAAEPTTPP